MHLHNLDKVDELVFEMADDWHREIVEPAQWAAGCIDAPDWLPRGSTWSGGTVPVVHREVECERGLDTYARVEPYLDHP